MGQSRSLHPSQRSNHADLPGSRHQNRTSARYRHAGIAVTSPKTQPIYNNKYGRIAKKTISKPSPQTSSLLPTTVSFQDTQASGSTSRENSIPENAKAVQRGHLTSTFDDTPSNHYRTNRIDCTAERKTENQKQTTRPKGRVVIITFIK